MRPSVDIIIPFRENYEKVVRAVSSIMSSTPNQEYKIILVDDCSSNKDFLKNLTYHNKKTIAVQLQQHSGFAAALKAGFDSSNNPHVVFFHSDSYTSNINWLPNLQRSLIRLKSKGIKLVSAKTNNLGTACNYDPNISSMENKDVIVNSPLPLFCSLCHRDLFKNIGGFLKPYFPVFFEDEELYFRMKYYGYKQAIAGNSWVEHEGGITVNQLDHRLLKLAENNRDKCIDDIKNYINAF